MVCGAFNYSIVGFYLFDHCLPKCYTYHSWMPSNSLVRNQKVKRRVVSSSSDSCGLNLGSGCYLALVTNAFKAVYFLYCCHVSCVGTYLLFNAGITVFLTVTQEKQKDIYYKPNNLSVSNLIFHYEKMLSDWQPLPSQLQPWF